MWIQPRNFIALKVYGTWILLLEFSREFRIMESYFTCICTEYLISYVI